MRRHDNWLISGLIFPVAPIAVIVFTCILCLDIWQAWFYTPGEDGGEVEPMLALMIIPILLLVCAGLLAGLTALTRWVAARYKPGHWWRIVMSLPRIVLVAASSFMFLLATGFFIGDPSAVFEHWQVICACIAFAASLGAFWHQQYARLWR